MYYFCRVRIEFCNGERTVVLMKCAIIQGNWQFSGFSRFHQSLQLLFFFGYIICILPEAQEEDSPICSHSQAVWVWTVSLPLTVVNASDRDPSVKPQDIIGWLMWVVGIIVEATADQQKLAFKNSPANKGKWCNIGLWKYSRHPNYFGEVSFIGSSTFLFTFSLL